VARRRVLTIAGQLASVGGTEVAQCRVFGGLAARGWDVHLRYVSRGDLWPAWRALSVEAQQIGASFPVRGHLFRSSADVARASVGCLRTHPDVTYVHNAGDALVALFVASLTRTPFVVHLHVPPPYRQPSWLNAVLRRARSIFVPAADTGDRWTRVAGLDPGVVQVAPTGIDVERFVPVSQSERRAVRTGIGVEENERMVLFVGRVEQIKGPQVLLAAAASMSDRPHVVLCGSAHDDQFRSQLESIASGRVTFLGRRSDVAQLMAAADLVAVPSIIPEPQPLVITEALACGTPVVTSDIGGLPESMAGFPSQLAPPDDAEALAAAIESVIDWRHRDPTLGARSREWVLANRSLSVTVDRVDEMLRRVVERR
jgi:glycosyltransferase involved in cell wall biosynthesis